MLNDFCFFRIDKFKLKILQIPSQTLYLATALVILV